ncbi:DNA topoisomerase, partial [Parabacteroides distasonis]
PLFLSKEDNTVYQMIAGRMVEAFSDKCVKELTTVTALSGEAEFAAKGCVIRQTGWRAVLGEDSEEQILPGWKSGETLSVCGVSLTEGKTKPKPLHTEATLLSAMETAGKD